MPKTTSTKSISQTVEKTPDTQYRELLSSIVENGVRTPSQQGVDALTLIGPATSLQTGKWFSDYN